MPFTCYSCLPGVFCSLVFNSLGYCSFSQDFYYHVSAKLLLDLKDEAARNYSLGCFFIVNTLHYIYVPAMECHHIFHNSVSLASESYKCRLGCVLSVGCISERLQTNAPSPFEVGGQWEQDEVSQQFSCLIQFPEMTKGNMPSDTFHAQWSQPPRPGCLPVRT